jgi:hypothetical protein
MVREFDKVVVRLAPGNPVSSEKPVSLGEAAEKRFGAWIM